MGEQSRRTHVRPAATERRNRYCSIRRNDACNARVHHKEEKYLTTLIKKGERGLFREFRDTFNDNAADHITTALRNNGWVLHRVTPPGSLSFDQLPCERDTMQGPSSVTRSPIRRRLFIERVALNRLVWMERLTRNHERKDNLREKDKQITARRNIKHIHEIFNCKLLIKFFCTFSIR